jgi:hypothetical protein
VAFPFGTGLEYSSFTEKWSDVQVSSEYEPVTAEPLSNAQTSLSASALQQAINAHHRAPHLAPTVAQISCVIKNTGKRTSAHVVIATSSVNSTNTDSSASAAETPLKSVIGFERVLLGPQESVTVTFNITAFHFAAHAGVGGVETAGRGRWRFELMPQQQAQQVGDSKVIGFEVF